MVRLAKVGARYRVPFTVVDGGSGIVHGEISETDQRQIPVYAFVNSRHVLRTPIRTALQTGMVLRSPAGIHFIVGENGPSELPEGTLWQSWRLFEATGQYSWVRRTKVMDVVTELEREGEPEDLGMIWAAVEPLDREVSDFRMSASHEQSRVITGRDIRHDDLVDGRKVTRAELSLGIKIGVLT